MAKQAMPRQDPLYDEKREFWLIALIRTIVILMASYFVAVFVNLFIARVAEIPHGEIWDAVKGSFYFILVILSAAGISIPYWMKEWDPTLRTFSMFTSALTIAYAVLDQSGFIDPELPMKWLMAHPVAWVRSHLSL
jgi:hypothetical protein